MDPDLRKLFNESFSSALYQKYTAELTRRLIIETTWTSSGCRTRTGSAVSSEDRDRWCLREKVRYEPALHAADGGRVKVEIRMMFFRPDDQVDLVLGENLARLSRGNMMGVDFNKHFSWVGLSICQWEE